jgi:ribonuclease HI
VEELTRYLGHATNNIAEYRALILGLEAVRRRGAAEVRARMDSELVVRQVSGQYKVRNPQLRLLHAQVMDLARSFRRFTIEHVPRAANALADRLANQAIDEAIDGAPGATRAGDG